MSNPVTERTQISISNRGIDELATSIEINSVFWNVVLRGSFIYVQEYGGRSFRVSSIFGLKKFDVTHKYNELLEVSDDTFWLWGLDVFDNLNLYEIKPNRETESEVVNNINIKENLDDFSIYIPVVNYPVIVTKKNNDLSLYKYDMKMNKKFESSLHLNETINEGITISLPITERKLFLVYSDKNILFKEYKRKTRRIVDA